MISSHQRRGYRDICCYRGKHLHFTDRRSNGFEWNFEVVKYCWCVLRRGLVQCSVCFLYVFFSSNVSFDLWIHLLTKSNIFFSVKNECWLSFRGKCAHLLKYTTLTICLNALCQTTPRPVSAVSVPIRSFWPHSGWLLNIFHKFLIVCLSWLWGTLSEILILAPFVQSKTVLRSDWSIFL